MVMMTMAVVGNDGSSDGDGINGDTGGDEVMVMVVAIVVAMTMIMKVMVG